MADFYGLGKKIDRRFDIIEDKVEHAHVKLKNVQEEIKSAQEELQKIKETGSTEDPYTDKEVIDAVNELWQ